MKEFDRDNTRRDSQIPDDREVFEITPLVLGGDPTDASNKVVLTRIEHIEAVRYWNSVIRQLRKSTT